MEQGTDTGRTKFWNFIDNFKGDKVIWMIVLLLVLISLVSIFASTSGLAEDGVSRLDIFMDQLKLVCGGLFIILFCYNFMNVRIIRALSSFGFILSLILLICLYGGLGVEINGAVRALQIGGVQIYVFEVIKVSMVMYLSWAIFAYKEDRFFLPKLIAGTALQSAGGHDADGEASDPAAGGEPQVSKLAFVTKPWFKRLWYIYLPILIICAGMFKGGISSTLFCGLVMFLVILIGGMPKREIFGALIVGLAIVGIFTGIYFASDGDKFSRIGTAINRLTLHREYEVIAEGNTRSDEYRTAMDKIRQPEGAKLAVKEGGLIGKGPGGSTQKYSVFAIFSDYMYSFIVEEYGLIGGIIVLILYVSLLARGSLIARFCDDWFSKTAVAGLVLLISGQALMHIFINVNIGPLTGQTLPMVSHGSSSFLSFSVAFGALLSISRLAKKNMDTQAVAADENEEAEMIAAETVPEEEIQEETGNG